MSLKLVFHAEELLKINDSELNFCKKISKLFKPIIILDKKDVSIEDSITKKIEQIPLFEYEKNKQKIQVYLLNLSNQEDWIIFFTNDNYIFSKNNIVVLKYHFWEDLNKYKHISFTEHAKHKLLYNEFSYNYMNSIANNTNLETKFLINIFKKENIVNIIDCCCGVGRHDYILAQNGYHITGIDISPKQIETANMIHSHDNINYIISDVRNFRLKKRNFDASICMWTTYNYFSQISDLKLFLNNVWEHLKNNGLMILESKNIPILDKERLYMRNKETNDISMNLLVYKRILGNVQNSQYFYFINEKGQKKFLLDEEFVRFYYLDELINILDNKFKLITVYGNFYGDLYNPNKSERMISVWRAVK